MRILQVKAARGWSCEQAAEAFMIDEQTMRSWLRRVDEKGEGALIHISEPVNKFPDFVRYLVKQLKVLLPTMGKARIAEILARAGLHLGVTTVGRILKETEPMPGDAATLGVIETRVVTARHPGDVWHVDLTTVPTGPGFWVPWVPFALPQSWPFCWWIAVVVDHFSRAVVGFALFHDHPTSGDRWCQRRTIQALGGRTPWEVHSDIRPANSKPRLEPRKNWPTTGFCASLQTAIQGRRGTKLSLVVGYVEGRRHLPVVELRKTA